jgi:DNA-binding MarR family transcriptional regulator
MELPTKTEQRTSTGGLAAAGLPLPALLSQALVAFTIEFDNEFERRMPHRTTVSRAMAGSRDGPWLVSMVMGSNLMRFVGEERLTVGELQSLVRTANLPLAGMERWGYIAVNPDPAGGRPKPPLRDWLVRPTAEGRSAQGVWRPLFGIIENRWKARFGENEIGRLRESLETMIRQFDFELPEYLPVAGYGLFSEILREEGQTPALRESDATPALHVPALLSKVLLAFTLEFERESELSLAVCANVLRLVGEGGVRVRDLRRMAGVSKEAMAMALSFLEKCRYVGVGPDPTANRTKLVWLTSKGRNAQEAYPLRLGAIEVCWRARFGEDNIRKLRESLEPLVGDATEQGSPLFLGLEPHPEGWRAALDKPATLPHHPMVLHRGGYPDGS